MPGDAALLDYLSENDAEERKEKEREREKMRCGLTMAKARPQKAPKVLTRSFQTGAQPVLPLLLPLLLLFDEGEDILYSALTASSSSS